VPRWLENIGGYCLVHIQL